MPVDKFDIDLPGEYDPSQGSLIIENEILLMKLRAEFGAKIFLPENRVEPEIENHFLRTVYEFEQKSAAGRNREIIFHRIGEPLFPDESELDDEQVSEQLDRLNELLFSNKIVLDTLAEYPERLLYKFITDEFLHMEIDISAAGDYFMHFCYEDFYPNHEYDITQLSSLFISFLMDDIIIVPRAGLYTRIRTSSKIRTGYKEVLTIIQSSFADFETRTLETFEIENLSILDEMAFVDFLVSYNVTMTGMEKLSIRGKGKLEFVYSDDSWWICFFSFPGVVI